MGGAGYNVFAPFMSKNVCCRWSELFGIFCIVSINLGFDSFKIKSEQDRPYWCASAFIVVRQLYHFRRNTARNYCSLSHRQCPKRLLRRANVVPHGRCTIQIVVSLVGWCIWIFEININKNINMWHKYCMLCDIKKEHIFMSQRIEKFYGMLCVYIIKKYLLMNIFIL